ncbi:30S ribosomal protein S17 [Candidatus Daviesbacteria bacterium]|nr:30S ribosomal protein S17 [Candidatus Daviesbacteria bacterium]
MTGRVVSAKLAKTVTVLVERIARHPVYKKTFKQSKRYLVHDELGAKEGDIVDILKVKPISKNKHWEVKKIIGQDIAEMVKEKLKEEAQESIAEVMPEEEKEGEEVKTEEIIKVKSQKRQQRKENKQEDKGE